MIRKKRQSFGRALLIAAIVAPLLFVSAPASTHAAEEDAKLPTEIIGEDGAPMVLVPAGEFIMGNQNPVRFGSGGFNQRPHHTVYLDTFYIDKYELSIARYDKYVKANGGGEVDPAYLPTNSYLIDLSRHANIPVTSILWKSAKGYCEWTGKRLPTEAEWEKAARGRDGRPHPWGDTPPTNEHALFATPPQEWQGPDSFAPIDSYPKGVSPYGAHHMAGNVFEWVNDLYLEEYYEETPLRNPQGPKKGRMNKHGKRLSAYTIRGGSAKSMAGVLTTTFRAGWSHMYTPPHGGFRCAKSAGNAGATESDAGDDKE